MEALADSDGLRLADLTCDSSQGDLQASMFVYSALGVLSSMYLEGARPQINVDEVTYDTVRDDGISADVHVSGRLRFGLLMTTSAQPINDVYHMRFEDGAWKMCGSQRYAGS
jgi:hypothetical protein